MEPNYSVELLLQPEVSDLGLSTKIITNMIQIYNVQKHTESSLNICIFLCNVKFLEDSIIYDLVIYTTFWIWIILLLLNFSYWFYLKIKTENFLPHKFLHTYKNITSLLLLLLSLFIEVSKTVSKSKMHCNKYFFSESVFQESMKVIAACSICFEELLILSFPKVSSTRDLSLFFNIERHKISRNSYRIKYYIVIF